MFATYDTKKSLRKFIADEKHFQVNIVAFLHIFIIIIFSVFNFLYKSFTFCYIHDKKTATKRKTLDPCSKFCQCNHIIIFKTPKKRQWRLRKETNLFRFSWFICFHCGIFWLNFFGGIIQKSVPRKIFKFNVDCADIRKNQKQLKLGKAINLVTS